MRQRLTVAILACLLVLAAACRETTAPKLEPDPFPNAIPLKVWLSATGALVRPGALLRLGATVFDSATYALATFPPARFDRWTYRIAWWSSDPDVAIVTDSASDLPPEVAASYGIRVVPLIVSFGEASFRAGVTMTTVHNREGQTATVKDGNGNTTTYEYDANGNLTSFTDVRNNATGIPPASRTLP